MKLSKAELRFDEWARYAEEDQKMVEIALKEEGPPNQICFHSQQVAEKYLKGYLVFSGREFEKNHLLRYLFDLCEEVDPTFRELEDDVIYLTQFYTETRYPGDIPEFNLSECQRAFEAALRIKEFVLTKVGPSKADGGFGIFGIVAVVAVIIAAAAIGGGLYWRELKKRPAIQVCTQEAKLCPDGSSVGRVPPACEFTKCPGENGASIDTSQWKTYRNERYGFEVRYPPTFTFREFPPLGDERELVLPKEIVVVNYEVYYSREEPGYIPNFYLQILPNYLAQTPEEAAKVTNSSLQRISLGGNRFQTIEDSTALLTSYYLKHPKREVWFYFYHAANISLDEIKNHPKFLDYRRQEETVRNILSTFIFID